MGEITWRQLMLRNRLDAIDKYINDYRALNDKQIMHKRHEVIKQLNEVQLEEWNYD